MGSTEWQPLSRCFDCMAPELRAPTATSSISIAKIPFRHMV